MKQIKVNPNNEHFYSKEFIRGFNLGAERQYEADIADMPTWIPCSERLPDEDGEYLVWAKTSFVPDHVGDPSTCQSITIASYYGNAHPIAWFGRSIEKVIAWMPLPSAYKRRGR